ncbi:hypothetical protein [Streptomyces johnsoniae]|uniref:Uncharacterized protein n=1 Tax=Streptomyces johnsoniae TaxID=3075532 RepID=A0ABU2SA24_9ACTN|nr:hypothetical protein [Streptomyces sp. DSM 41886]MDT0445827.1 hypothetical protein [Streptomyces sp. DSM 41886]
MTRRPLARAGQVMTSVEVTAQTVRRGDRLAIGGQDFTVRDLTTMHRGTKRLEFTTGETFTMTSGTVRWAARPR